MEPSYQDEKIAGIYLHYLKTAEARQEQEAVWQALKKRLPGPSASRVLDAACGNGWLTAKLASLYQAPEGVDSSERLIQVARQEYPAVHFTLADLLAPLPFPPQSFDTIVFNMAAHDVSNLQAALENLKTLLQPQGKLLVTVANPYYSFPVGVWKRGLLRFLLKMRPVLKLRPYNKFALQTHRLFRWKQGVPSYFRTLPEYIGIALKAGLNLAGLEEVISPADSKDFDRLYQLYRFPMILMLEFKKILE